MNYLKIKSTAKHFKIFSFYFTLNVIKNLREAYAYILYIKLHLKFRYARVVIYIVT